MKILAVGTAYNEEKYLPEMVRYYREQGCDILILDNYSTDGTYQWLLDNNIKTTQVDTMKAFHLDKLQRAMENEIAKYDPNWVVYVGIDIYYSFDKTIRETIEETDSRGFNVIQVNNWSIYNTGEERDIAKDTYFYGTQGRGLRMIAKYDKPFRLCADEILIPCVNIFQSDGILVNYGNTKPKEEREETFERRKRAWEMGLTKGWGVHYPAGSAKGWIWDKSELTDVRTTKFNKYFEKL